jgi:hypothetical protein
MLRLLVGQVSLPFKVKQDNGGRFLWLSDAMACHSLLSNEKYWADVEIFAEDHVDSVFAPF